MIAFTFDDVFPTTVFEQANWWVREYNTNGRASEFIEKSLKYEIDFGESYAQNTCSFEN